MANILILGGGFGGLMAAEQLAKTIDARQYQIMLVSPRKNITFYPALVRLAFGDCRTEDIEFDLVEKLKRLDVRFVQGEAVQLNHKLKRVRVTGTDFDGEILYDYLVIAVGRRLATEKISGFFEYAQHLLGVKAALKFGEAVKNFRRGHIVCGLAPEALLPIPVCETAFSLARRFAAEIEKGTVKISVVFPETIKKTFGGADLHRKLERAFAERKINLVTDFAVREVSEKFIIADDQKYDYDLLMLVPPFRGHTMFDTDDLTDEKHFVKTDNFLRASSAENIYAVGDIAAFPGPKLAYMAIRQAQVAAENTTSELRGNIAHKIYNHDLAVVIDEAGAEAIFLHYGICDKTLHNIKEGTMWSRLKNTNNYLWEMVSAN